MGISPPALPTGEAADSTTQRDETMQEIIPYTGPQEALEALDNGGRFYNLLTRAGDDEVEPAELARAAGVGVIGSRQRMFLFLKMALWSCSPEEQSTVWSHLSDRLRKGAEEHAPQVLDPSEARGQGIAGRSAIITGYPRFLEDRTTFQGFLFMPVYTGKVMTMMPIPIHDSFDVYELRDEESSEVTFLANLRGQPRLPERRTRFGGVLKETREREDADEPGALVLEGSYLTALPG